MKHAKAERPFAESNGTVESFTATVLEVLRHRYGSSMRASDVVRDLGPGTSEADVEAALEQLVKDGHVTSEIDSSGLRKVLRYTCV